MAVYLFCLLHAPSLQADSGESAWGRAGGRGPRAMLGHSQGMAAAAVAAAAGSVEELMLLSEACAARLFWLALRISQATSSFTSVAGGDLGRGRGRGLRAGATQWGESSRGSSDESNQPGLGPWSLGVAKVEPAAVEAALLHYPYNVGAGSELRVVIRNGPRACVVAGAPRAVARFEEWLREEATRNAALRGAAVRDWGSTAAFHHAGLLAGVADRVEQDTGLMRTIRAGQLRRSLVNCR